MFVLTCRLTVEPAKGGDADTLEADVVLVSTGRSSILGASAYCTIVLGS